MSKKKDDQSILGQLIEDQPIIGVILVVAVFAAFVFCLLGTVNWT